MTVGTEMEFRKKLLTVGMALSKDETEALAFLCTDILNRTVDPSSVESAVEFFDRLEAHGVLSEDHPFLLADLLDVIGRYRLLREFDLNCKRSTTRSLIPSYRKLLYQLSENITENDLKSIKFLLTKDLQRARLEPNVSTLEVFLALERKDLLSSSDLRLLEQILGQVCPVLLKDIQQFKATHGEQTPHLKGRIAQETGLDDLPPRSSSGISGHGTTTTSLLEGPPSEEIPGFHRNHVRHKPLTLLGHLGGLRPGQETLIAVAEIAIWPHHLYALHLRTPLLGHVPQCGSAVPQSNLSFKFEQAPMFGRGLIKVDNAGNGECFPNRRCQSSAVKCLIQAERTTGPK
uniref:Caspase 10, apoptosis-related cysteine peptidase n=1 Tax=Gadus morhua TaxID=8049 RepID=A0A8C5BD45_GADMO